jgi:SRSO17 transposase
VLVRAATGVRNNGAHSTGGARQDRGPAGTGETGPIGVWLGDARARDRPAAWTQDRERGRQAGMPAARGVATTPPRACHMRARSVAASVPAPWLTGDGVSGDDRRQRRWREARPPASGRAVSGQESVWGRGPPRQVNTRLARLSVAGWSRLRAGEGAQGPRWDAWRWRPRAAPVDPPWRRGRLVRRRVSTPPARQASGVCAPQASTLAAVGRVAGSRWTLERGVEAAQGEVGVDHDDVRGWTGWDRPIPRVLWARALLPVRRAGTMAVEM